MNTSTDKKRRVSSLFNQPLFELINQAYQTHKQHFNPENIELCSLCSIKTGGCPEDCAYCPQSAHYNTGVQKETLLNVEQVTTYAKKAKQHGATRFCMGAAWKYPPKKDFPTILAMISMVKKLGLETCVTLGQVNQQQAIELKHAGLDYYNHNLDTSPRYYKQIIRTRQYHERIDTISHIVNANIHVCCGGILGMGEHRNDRIDFIVELMKLPSPPKSIPINHLIPISGTPLANQPPLNPFEFVKTIAVIRMVLPQTTIRLSAGRETMSDEMQAWCFMAGANSIFIGDKLLTANNANPSQDLTLLTSLGLQPCTALEASHNEQ